MTKAELKYNKWWVGSNSWDANIYSQEEAEKHSITLKNCDNCFNCRSCSYCRYCLAFETNPQRIVSPILGSRNSNTTYYWNDDKEQIVCGCFKGTMEEFKSKIKETHGDNDFAKGYYKWIEAVEIYKNSLQ